MDAFKSKKGFSFYKGNSDKKPHLYSAGILPYQIKKIGKDKKVYFLLAKDINGYWSDFGGKCEGLDNLNIKETASREFYEESYGSVVSLDGIRTVLKNDKNFKLINSESMGGISYYMFITRLPMIAEETRDRFKTTLNYVQYINADFQYREKVDIQWISLETLLLLLKSEKNETKMGWPLRRVFKKTLFMSIRELNELKHEI